MKISVKKSTYHPELDGIRALAIIFVIINHFNDKILPSGFLGVDMFFVLSGYVVSSSLYHRPVTHWFSFLAQFYARRMRRILPALIFCVLMTCFLGCFFIKEPGLSLRSGMYSLLGVSNIYFYRHSSDYFGEDARHNLFTHTWSLGVEEQFYLLFPLLVVFIGFKAPKKLRITLIFLTLLSLGLWVWMQRLNDCFAFFMIFTRFWELGLGCITFLLVINHGINSYFTIPSILPAFLSLIIISIVIFLPQNQLLISNISMCLAVATLIYSMREPNLAVRLMSQTWMVRIGVLSYSLYLWHWPVLSISRHTIGINLHTVFYQIVLIILLAQFSFIFIEKPFRYSKLLKKDRVSIVVGLSTMAFSCVLIGGLNHTPNILFSANKPSFDLTKPIFTLQTSLEQCKNSSEVIKDVFPPKCYYSSGAKNTLWMVGDSTTWALKGFASELAAKRDFNIAIYSDDSAFPSAKILRIADGKNKLRWDGVRDFFDKTFNYILKWSQPGDLVLITGNLSHEFCNYPELYCHRNPNDIGWHEFNGKQLSINDAFLFYLEEMGELTKLLAKKNVHLIISAPLPRWEREHSIYCESQWFRPKWEHDKCLSPDFVAQGQSRARILSVIKEAQNKYGFYVYDPFPFFCNEISCNFSNPKNNDNYWIDETHLSTSGGMILAPNFDLFLQSQRLISKSGIIHQQVETT